MLRLYNGSPGGSSEIQLQEREDQERWERLRRNAVRFMRDSGDPEPAELLESLPFQMWSGTNGFGDDFDLLYLPATPRNYADFEQQVDEKRDLWRYRSIAQTLEKLNRSIRFIAVDVNMDGAVESVAVPELRITSEVVERALADAQTLIGSRGAVSGLDRVHTAFHGYLKAACADAGLATNADAGITELFKVLRKGHLAFKGDVAGRKEIDRIVNALAAIVDALNPLRNRGSVAHANEALLDEPEAMLAINAVRTMLHYLNSKLNR